MQKTYTFYIKLPLKLVNFKQQDDWYISLLQDTTTMLNEISDVTFEENSQYKDMNLIAKNKYINLFASNIKNGKVKLCFQHTIKHGFKLNLKIANIRNNLSLYGYEIVNK